MLFSVKRMVTLTQLVRLFFVAGTLVSVTLGASVRIGKGDKVIILSKADIGSIITNITAEICGKITRN